MSKYFQCDLSQNNSRSRAYIEERGAKVGNLVEVKEDGFTGLWRVDSVANKGIEDAPLKDMQRKSRNYIKNTDI
jgi:hypothetical protein